MDQNRLGSQGERDLQKQYGTQTRAEGFYDRQMLDYLNPQMQEFIRKQELLFISTADGNGECDCSFRAGLPGFIHVADRKHVLYPEYRGNGVFASLGNITENPHVGLMFIDFFESTIGLHVNGRATIVGNDDLRQRPFIPDSLRDDLLTTGGRKPERWVQVEVHEAYIHCSKHIPLLSRREKNLAWGTDDMRLKGGDFFGATACKRQQTDGTQND